MIPAIPVITIVTPSFNQGEFIAETIESVIGQAGDFFIDYVIVDGGSIDDSVQIIREYDDLLQQGKWPVACRGITYRWLSEQDRGQADALMKGFRMAAGEILAWLNSDDLYLPGALETAADFFRNNQEGGLMYGAGEYCDREGVTVGRYRTQEFDFRKLAWFNFICQPSTFFRAEFFHGVGGLDTTLRFAMDFDLWIRMSRQFPGSYLPRLLSRYRLHGGSKTVIARTLSANCEEALSVTMKQFGWAPLTRVYNACHALCLAKLPPLLAGNRAAVILATACCTLTRSLLLNRGIRRKELKLLTGENFEKIFKSRLEIMTNKPPSS